MVIGTLLRIHICMQAHVNVLVPNSTTVSLQQSYAYLYSFLRNNTILIYSTFSYFTSYNYYRKTPHSMPWVKDPPHLSVAQCNSAA